jgi:H+/Cl- antiporter ClcA
MLVHVTVSPTAIVTELGLNAKFLMLMLIVDALATGIGKAVRNAPVAIAPIRRKSRGVMVLGSARIEPQLL